MRPADRDAKGRTRMSDFRQFAIAAACGLMTAACAFAAPAYAAGPEVVAGPSAEPNCFVPWTDKTKFFKFARQERAVPHRARQRIHRQHLAYPDDSDGQGLCGAAGCRRQAQGVQSRFDWRRRRRADRGDQQFHRFRFRRHRRQCAKSGGVQAGHQTRQRRGRRARRLRQHSRHGGCDQRRRRPEGSWRLLG